MKSNIEMILHELHNVSEVYLEYTEKAKNIKKDYANNRLLEEIEALKTRYKGELTKYINVMNTQVTNLKKEIQNINDFNPGDEKLYSTADLLKNSGMNPNTVYNICEKFVGNQTALDILHASAHDDYKSIIKSLMFNPMDEIRKIEGQLDAMVYSDIESLPSTVSSVRTSVLAFAKHQGIDSVATSSLVDELRAINIASIVGVNI